MAETHIWGYSPLRVGRRVDPAYELIFLHGFAVYNAVYVDGIRAVVGDVGEGLLYNLPGHGGSAGRINPASISGLGARIAEDIAPATPAVICAESLGCLYAPSIARVLQKEGVQVHAAILLAPPALLNLVQFALWGFEMLRHSPAAVLRNRFPMHGPFRDTQTPEMVRRFQNDPHVKKEVDLYYLWRSFRDVIRFPRALRQLKCPLLLVQGSRDPLLLRLNLGWALNRSLATAKKAVLLRGAGHSLLWDAYTREVVDEGRRWIDRYIDIGDR